MLLELVYNMWIEYFSEFAAGQEEEGMCVPGISNYVSKGQELLKVIQIPKSTGKTAWIKK